MRLPQATALFALALYAACGSGSSSKSSSPGSSGSTSETVVPKSSVKKVACAAHTPQHEIAMRNLAFSPAALEIQPGDVVRWTNEDNVPHTVTNGSDPAAPGAGTLVDSGTLDSGATVCYQFMQAGSFPYFCRIHGAAMKGEITVGSASKSGGTTDGNTGGNTGGTGGY